MNSDDVSSLLKSGEIKQLRIGIDCQKCGYDECIVLESCVLVRGGAVVGISLGYACMRCAEVDEWYAAFSDIVNEAAKIGLIDKNGTSGDEEAEEDAKNKEKIH